MIPIGRLGLDGKIILKLIVKKWNEGLWPGVHLTQDSIEWWAFVNKVMNIK
jgi:hypothetical protein